MREAEAKAYLAGSHLAHGGWWEDVPDCDAAIVCGISGGSLNFIVCAHGWRIDRYDTVVHLESRQKGP